MPSGHSTASESAQVEARLTVPFVDLGAQHAAIAGELDAAIERVLARADFILGEDVAAFEKEFAEFAGAGDAVGVSSGLAALELALRVMDVGPGDEVILPANTFIATALAVSATGARPVLADCDRSTYEVDPRAIEAAITPRTKVILPVHLYGQPGDMDAILAIAARHGLVVVEDAAQAHGATYRGRPCGSLGRLGCFSFYPAKNLGAAGDGGMITTSDARLAQRLRRLRNYGEQAKYEHVERGGNARLDTLQAAILRVKLRYLAQWNQLRVRHAEEYRRQLAGVGDLAFQKLVPDATHVYHLFVIETERRDALRGFLAERSVRTGIHYPKPIHLQKAYADLGHRPGDFPHAESLASRALSLPMYPELTGDQVDYVCEQVRRFFAAQG